MRQIANNVYIPVLKDLVEEGKEVSMMISGSSMNPFLIHQRDYILMKKPEEELKAGDMVFFQRRDEAYVMHRIHHINKEGKEVSMMISGSSMNPFLIHQRDYILMKKPEEELKAGDMVFFQRRDEAYVMHRIHHINKEGKLFIIGDAQVDMEGPIDKEQVFAIITKVKRKGKWIAPGDFWWEFFEHIWLHLIPFRRFLMKLYGIRR